MSQQTDRSGEAETDQAVIDCDVHIGLDEEALVEYLPPVFQDRGITLGSSGTAHPHRRGIDERGQGWSEPASVENTKKYLLDEFDIETGIITGSTACMGVAGHQNYDYALALAKAHNEWVATDWLPEDDRLRGSILVAPQRPEESAELIDEYADEDDFVQVIMGSGSLASYGKRMYWPIYEAAEAAGLPVGIHPPPGSISPPFSASGHPSSYFEAHCVMGQHYQGQVVSMITEGVFVEYPDLQFVCIEGGFGWVPHVMWRMDKKWRSLGDQAPWLEEPPSRYLREHVRFTSQPIEEPETDDHLLQLFEMMHADETLLFSSDFPHYDGDDPVLVLPNKTPDELRHRIMYENANELYDL